MEYIGVYGITHWSYPLIRSLPTGHPSKVRKSVAGNMVTGWKGSMGRTVYLPTSTLPIIMEVKNGCIWKISILPSEKWLYLKGISSIGGIGGTHFSLPRFKFLGRVDDFYGKCRFQISTWKNKLIKLSCYQELGKFDAENGILCFETFQEFESNGAFPVVKRW